MINAGWLNKKITIGETRSGINPDTGRNEGARFEGMRTVWAGVKHVNGSEYFAAAAVNAQETMTFTVRYQPDLEITTKHIIQYAGKEYDIKAINDVNEKHEILIIMAEARI